MVQIYTIFLKLTNLFSVCDAFSVIFFTRSVNDVVIGEPVTTFNDSHSALYSSTMVYSPVRVWSGINAVVVRYNHNHIEASIRY